jgi:hypothetical protein
MKRLIAVAVLSFLAGGAMAALASSPGDYFEGVADVRGHADDFRSGYAAGIYDTVSVFAQAAQGGSISSQRALSLFTCLDRQGDKLNEFRSWTDGVWSRTTGNHPAVQALVDYCLSSP